MQNFLTECYGIVCVISATVAVRVLKKLKDELRDLKLDYAEDVRECLEKKGEGGRRRN